MVATNQIAREKKKIATYPTVPDILSDIISIWTIFVHAQNQHLSHNKLSLSNVCPSTLCDGKNIQAVKARWAQPSVFLTEDAKMQKVGESLTSVAHSALISRSHWFWDNFNIGKIIHSAKDLTSEAGAMEEISMSHHWPMEVQSRQNCILQIYTVLLHECRAACLRDLGWKAPQHHQWFYFQENALAAF